jgi:hypothetical protein
MKNPKISKISEKYTKYKYKQKKMDPNPQRKELQRHQSTKNKQKIEKGRRKTSLKT